MSNRKVEYLSPQHRARAMAKRDLIAQAAVVANAFEKVALDMRLTLDELRDKKIDEWEMCEKLFADALQIFYEAGLTELMGKYTAFRLAEQAALRADFDRLQ